jgi:NAD(P)H-dependent FMN reductase
MVEPIDTDGLEDTDGGKDADGTETTDEPVRIAGLVGSLADRSVTRVAVTHALDAAAAGGAETDLLDLREFDLPLYNADADSGADGDGTDSGGDASELRTRLRRADGIVLGTPMYHGSYSSPLKTALDYSGFDEFENTTVGLLAVSGGAFPITALDHLRSVMRALDAWVVPFQAAVPNSHSAVEWHENGGDPIGELTNESTEDRVATLGRRVVQYANIEPDPISFEGQQNVGAE